MIFGFYSFAVVIAIYDFIFHRIFINSHRNQQFFFVINTIHVTTLNQQKTCEKQINCPIDIAFIGFDG